jgi:hypothetical protein
MSKRYSTNGWQETSRRLNQLKHGTLQCEPIKEDYEYLKNEVEVKEPVREERLPTIKEIADLLQVRK